MKPIVSGGLLAATIAAALWLRPGFSPSPIPLPEAGRPPSLPAPPVSSGPARPPHPPVELDPESPENRFLTSWQRRLTALLERGERREEAAERLAAEVDEQYHRWVSAEVRALALRPPADRYDRLAELEQEITDGASAIFEHLGIDGAPPVTVLVDSLEVIAAEVQYAEAAATPEARLALLRLDRERQVRLAGVVAAAGSPDAAEPAIQQEVEAWYDQQMAVIVAMNGSPEPSFESGREQIAR